MNIISIQANLGLPKYKQIILSIEKAIEEGKLVKGITPEAAEAAVQAEIAQLLQQGVTEQELQKAKNKTESIISFEDMSLMNRANNLAFYELLGDAAEMNTELNKYQSVTAAQFMETANTIFTETNSNTLYYRSNMN